MSSMDIVPRSLFTLPPAAVVAALHAAVSAFATLTLVMALQSLDMSLAD